jgi:hypothetical protein
VLDITDKKRPKFGPLFFKIVTKDFFLEQLQMAAYINPNLDFLENEVIELKKNNEKVCYTGYID